MEIIRLTDVHKSYGADESSYHALKGISLAVRKGEFVSIMGPSGSGKTTLLDILGCISSPTSGSYALDGMRVDQLSHRELAHIRNSRLGFIFQNFNLIPQYTVFENVELPLSYAGKERRIREEAAMDALSRVGLSDRADRYPSQLSGGERQRVAIGRAMVNRPSLLLADEPTGNLDSRTGEGILAIFQEIHRQGNSIVLITHDQSVAAHASSSYYLKDGELRS